MENGESQSPRCGLNLVQTLTRTDGVMRKDRLKVSSTFIIRSSIQERRLRAAEDSAYVFLRAQCSSLNDF